MSDVSPSDLRRIELLEIVSKRGLKELSLEDLKELVTLVEKKDYSHNKKAQKSKTKLIAKINARIYDLEEKSMFR